MKEIVYFNNIIIIKTGKSVCREKADGIIINIIITNYSYQYYNNYPYKYYNNYSYNKYYNNYYYNSIR